MGCSLARKYFNLETTDYETTPTAYTGVFRANSVYSETAIFFYNAMVQSMGENTTISCTDNTKCGGQTCVQGFCFVSETHWHNALSLAFSLEDGSPDPSYWETESTWTESRWNTPTILMFKIDNPMVEIGAFVFGVVELIGSFVIVWFLRRYFTRQFKSG